jgi:hypothetical protein
MSWATFIAEFQYGTVKRTSTNIVIPAEAFSSVFLPLTRGLRLVLLLCASSTTVVALRGTSLSLLSRIKHDRHHVAVSLLASPLRSRHCRDLRTDPISWQQRSRFLQERVVHPLVFHRLTFMADAAPVRCPSPFNLII